jgi:hypothetical protein
MMHISNEVIRPFENDNELFATPCNKIAVKRAICKLRFHNKNELYNPCIGININVSGNYKLNG